MSISSIFVANRVSQTQLLVGRKQSGVSLIVSLLMLIVVLVLSISLTTISLQGEKASRSDRDRQIAFQAAEAGLKDAEMDIDPQIVVPGNRAATFDANSNLYFETGCSTGDTNAYQGMCAPAPAEQQPVWQMVDLTEAGASSVAFGRFTGQTMVTGKAAFPVKLPRYIIEAVQDAEAGQVASEGTKYIFRITAIGFGPTEGTQVVLQTFYRKALKS
jgi:type IV pilus assembly protein PilX